MGISIAARPYGWVYITIYVGLNGNFNCRQTLGMGIRNHLLLSKWEFQLPPVGGWVVRRCHVSFVTRGVQLILADSWARPAILVAGKGREVMFLFLLFLHFHSCFSFFPVPPFHLFCYLFCLFSPFLWETTQNDPQGLTCR